QPRARRTCSSAAGPTAPATTKQRCASRTPSRSTARPSAGRPAVSSVPGGFWTSAPTPPLILTDYSARRRPLLSPIPLHPLKRIKTMNYIPDPLDTSSVCLPDELTALTERLSENAHDAWAKRKLADGWVLGPALDPNTKRHPDLVPYA